MNQRTQFDEHEWQLQERALREEDAGAPAADERGLAAYREIARALRQPPQAEGLPADFAARVAALAQARAAMPESRLEQWLLHALLALLAVAGAGACVLYGGAQWLTDAQALLPSALRGAGLPWLLTLGACLALSWSVDPLRRGWSARHPG
ncbi:MAG TPA: hypothetical protein VFG18_07190 [Xanthomonadaceae bacterium]|jgi:hypothetical protein|nr:hypothetical protein [Xanthomonadaceae bacterium]